MISPLIKWNHDQNWYVPSYMNKDLVKISDRTVAVDVKDGEWSYLTGHILNGKIGKHLNLVIFHIVW